MRSDGGKVEVEEGLIKQKLNGRPETRKTPTDTQKQTQKTKRKEERENPRSEEDQLRTKKSREAKDKRRKHRSTCENKKWQKKKYKGPLELVITIQGGFASFRLAPLPPYF